MSDIEETGSKDGKKSGTSRAGRPGRLELRKTVGAGQVRQSFSHGRSKAVTVEVRRKRTFAPGEGGRMTELKPVVKEFEELKVLPETTKADATRVDEGDEHRPAVLRALTSEEKEARARAFEVARQVDVVRSVEEAQQKAEQEAANKIEEEARRKAEEEAAATRAEAESAAAAEVAAAVEAAAESPQRETTRPSPQERARAAPEQPEEPEEEKKGGKRKGDVRRPGAAAKREQPRRRSGKLTISQALSDEDRVRSLASVRRARERERRSHQPKQPIETIKIVREVVVPETMQVSELANRMAVRGIDVVKALIKMGTMATVNQMIDADTAELLVGEFGHKVKRVSAADVEIGLHGDDDASETLAPRPAVVTVMGHVDHGKTSLLDALRKTDVVAGEAGGITQHIGAYQVVTESGARITFIDTPGHAAFTAMRARGAKVTDIVVLVVAADDGVMPQTVEAINHAKAAGVPMIVAINKMDKSGVTPDRVRNELLQHGIVVEAMGGDVLDVEVSAVKKTNLDKLVEVILLQAEILELRANPDRPASGVVVEARLERGRGPVATVLVQRGTLRVGDMLVAGSEWARVRALNDERGQSLEEAGPSTPVEIHGLSGTPEAGDEMLAVENERRAREVTDYRKDRMRQMRVAAGSRGSLEQMFADIGAGTVKELPVVIKADVHGSAEAIVSSLEKLSTDEVAIRMLHNGVGGINESDITLAEASKAVVIGFNVRANAQARNLARRDNVEIRYYSVIYHLIDDLKGVLSGMLAPTLREHIVGNAQVLEVFEISKGGRAAGCRVIDGIVKRGATVRLLRDDTVLHEGKLSTLRRFKDDVREVKEGFECGMSFENYDDVRIGDIIEAVEIEEIARTL